MFHWNLFVIVSVHYKKEIGIDLESNNFFNFWNWQKRNDCRGLFLKKNEFIQTIYCPKNFRYRHVASLLKVGGQTHPKKLDKKKKGVLNLQIMKILIRGERGWETYTCNIPITWISLLISRFSLRFSDLPKELGTNFKNNSIFNTLILEKYLLR